MLTDREKFRLLETCLFEIMKSEVAGGDFEVGPVARIFATATPYDGSDLHGSIEMLVRLNEVTQVPISACFNFTDPSIALLDQSAAVVWPHRGTKYMKGAMQTVADKLVRLLAMHSISGYVEHDAALHRAYVSFAEF